MISVENLTKSFGAHLIFEGVSFKINAKERIGLVGRNGHGKTTLFRLITGKESQDSGTIVIPKNHRIGYVHQQIEFTEDTVLKEGMKGLARGERDHYWKVERILAGLGFSTADMNRHPEEFSGGYQVRLNLAKTLVSEPDLLLLDEPTNYLDIMSIRWIERFLLNWPHELMLITHDRNFMDKVVTHIMGVYHKKIRKLAGNTEKFYTQIAQDEEVYEKTRVNDERRKKEISNFISRFRAKARLANMVQSRIKTLEKMEKKEKLEKLKTLDFSFKSLPFHGKQVFDAENIFFSYDGKKPLIKDLSVTVRARDRICIIGKNGKGKTTLLKIFAGLLTLQKGKIVYNPAVTKGIFEQTNIKTLVNTRTVEEEILYAHPESDRKKARDICGAMMFEGNAALKKIRVLSGGEKSRVMLGKLLAAPVNLLLLDEPTNHLDMESCDAMLAAIDSFDGTVIMVTHNEMFLHALADRLIVFQNDGTEVFEGGYNRFLEKNGWQEEAEGFKPGLPGWDNTVENEPKTRLNKKEMRRKRSEIITERAKILKPTRQRISRIENDIEAREKELDNLNAAILEASQEQDGKKIAKISQSIHNCRLSIDKLFDELELFTQTFEEENAKFTKSLEQLEDCKAL